MWSFLAPPMTSYLALRGAAALVKTPCSTRCTKRQSDVMNQVNRTEQTLSTSVTKTVSSKQDTKCFS